MAMMMMLVSLLLPKVVILFFFVTLSQSILYLMRACGAILHVTPKKEFFTSYTFGDFGVLKMGNDGESKVIGVGDVCL